jgi:hypothetical protein
MTSNHSPVPPESNSLQKFWQQWTHFWFAATDPTTMAFMRIVTGVLVLYVHIVYTADLYSFFGKDAWYNLETANRSRLEQPMLSNTLWDWEWQQANHPKSARLPDEPHRKAAIVSYIRSLPLGDRAALDRALRCLDCEADSILHRRLSNRSDSIGYADQRDEQVAKAAVLYVPNLSADPTIRKNTLNALASKDPQIRDKREVFPPALDELSDEDRRRKVDEMEAFFQTLPKVDPLETNREKKALQLDARNFVIEYLTELDPNYRRNFLKFVRDLTTKTPEEREQLIESLAYWNYETRYAYRSGWPVFSIWYHISDPTEMAIAHGVILLIMLMFTVGYCTRITSVLTWLAAVGYIHRNPQVLFGQDTMMNILLIYLMIANSGAALSVDRWLNCRRARKLSLARSGNIDAATQAYLNAPPPSISTALAQRLLQVHFCFIYMAAGLSKLKGTTWWNHNAFWDTLINPEFTMVHFQWYENMLRWVASSRPAFAMIAAGGVWGTLFIEISLPFLVWTRLRWLAVCMGFLLHAGVGIFMGLLVFSLLMMTMLLAYIPGTAIRKSLFSSSTPGEPAA